MYILIRGTAILVTLEGNYVPYVHDSSGAPGIFNCYNHTFNYSSFIELLRHDTNWIHYTYMNTQRLCLYYV